MRVLPVAVADSDSWVPVGVAAGSVCWRREERVVILRPSVLVPVAAIAAFSLLGDQAIPEEGAGRVTRGDVGVCPCAAANNVVATRNATQATVVVGRTVKQPIINLSKKEEIDISIIIRCH